MKEGGVEVSPGKLSPMRLVATKSDFTREESTLLIMFEVNGERWFIPVTYQNAALNSGGGERNPREPRGNRIVHDGSCRDIEGQGGR